MDESLKIDKKLVIVILLESLESKQTPFLYINLKAKELQITLDNMYKILFNYPKTLLDIHNELIKLEIETKISYNQLFESLFQTIYHKENFDIRKFTTFDTIIYKLFFEFIENVFNIAIPILGYIPYNSIVNIQKSLNNNNSYSKLRYFNNQIVFDKNSYKVSRLKKSIRIFKLLNIKQPINFIFAKEFSTPFTINKYQNYIFSNEYEEYALIHELGHIIYHSYNRFNATPFIKLIKYFKSIYYWEDYMKIFIKDSTYLDYVLNENEIFARLFEIYALLKLNYKSENMYKNIPVYFFYSIWSDIDKKCLINAIDTIIDEFNCFNSIENANINNIIEIEDKCIYSQYIFKENIVFECYQYIKYSLDFIDPKFIMYLLGASKNYNVNELEMNNFKTFLKDIDNSN